MTRRIRKAVFPVAGLGTRFLPASKAIPKEMLTVVDKPLIQHVVEEAQAAGIEELVFVTGRGKTPLEDHFDHAYELEDNLSARGKRDELDSVRTCVPRPGAFVYTRQQEPLGLGHAVWCARHVVGDEPFAVVLPDDLVLSETPCLGQLVEAYDETAGNVVAVMEVPRDQTNHYGILDVARDEGRLVEVAGLVEKPEPAAAPSTLSIIGRYVLLPEVFAHLERAERGAGGELQLTDGLAAMIGKAPVHGLRYEGRRFDCGNKLGFLEANIAYALARTDTRDEAAKLLRVYGAGGQ